MFYHVLVTTRNIAKLDGQNVTLRLGNNTHHLRITCYCTFCILVVDANKPILIVNLINYQMTRLY